MQQKYIQSNGLTNKRLRNVLKDFAINNMKKTGLKEVAIFFSLDFNPSDTNDFLDIHKYLMEKSWFKTNILGFF